MEAKQKLEKEVTDLKEQLAAREELQKAYEALQKENESLQAKLNAVKSPEKSTGLRPAGDKPVGKAHTAVSDPHGNFEAVAKERDMLAEKVKGLEQELAVLRDSQKAATLDKVAADKQLVQGPKALPVCKARPENPAVPLAKGPAEEASASAGEVAAAQLRAELDNAKQEVATLRQQLADEQKSKDNYAALAEEAKKLKSEYEAFKMKSFTAFTKQKAASAGFEGGENCGSS
ncbi:hypothetical protein, conserved [Eimeria praecox]|uniref:Uncharacterized protein n=1 Tax=Eimeria praecox TaxID=51316 RepID=U6H666_9EIME|nr:hypothetical protein, conserved [Eimeria praecox]